MAKKPDAARGKTTRKGKIKKIMKQKISDVMKRQGKTVGMGMSPGAMGGRTKAKFTPRTGKMPSPLKRITENMRRQKLKGIVPMTGAAKSLIKGAGSSGSAIAKQAMKLAKKRKPTGRVNMDDIRRVKEMMSKRKGK